MQSLQGYENLEPIHGSEETVVFRATRSKDGQTVVIKSPSEAYPKPDIIAAYHHEFQLGSNLNHPNIIRYISLESPHDGVAIVLEDMDASELSEAIPSDGFPIETFLPVAIQLADALTAIHAQEIIHHQIAAKNILFNGANNTAKIADFSLATDHAQEIAKRSISKSELLAYCSPEQTGRINRVIDYRTDFYSIGVTFYQMLSGELPFNSNDPMEIIHGHIARPPKPLYELKPSIPNVVSRIVAKLLAKNVEDRYQNATGLKHDLQSCLNNLKQDGSIGNILLGQFDISEKFHTPQKLYSRDNDIQTIREILAISRKGPSRYLHFSGPAGIGKTALAQEAPKLMPLEIGHYVQGSFLENQESTYHALIQAFRSMVNQILGDDEESIRNWRKILLEKLGTSGNVLTELIPDLKLLIGEQPLISKLDPRDLETRNLEVFCSFLHACSGPSHPLVLFIDNLQWADRASLVLLRRFLSDSTVTHFTLITASRDQTSGELSNFFKQIDSSDIPLTEIQLQPLQPEALSQIVQDTLSTTPDKAKTLAEVIFQKTHGNPFYVHEFLKGLYQEGYLAFDSASFTWNWDAALVKQVEAGGNVIDLMVRRLKQLPPETLELIKISALNGSSIDISMLAAVTGHSSSQIINQLAPALEKEIVAPTHPSQTLSSQSQESGFSFHHDRVRSAAMELCNQDEATQLHFKIGTVLLKNTPSDQRGPLAGLIATHLNQARHLIQDHATMLDLASLNLQAGKKASELLNHQLASRFFNNGISSLPEDSWNQHAELTYKLHYEYSASSWLCDDFHNAETSFAELLQHANQPLQKAEVLLLGAVRKHETHHYQNALLMAIKALKVLDHEIPMDTTFFRIILERFALRWNIGGTDIKDFADRPTIKDPTIKLVMQLLSRVSSLSLLECNYNLFALTNIRLVKLAVKYGNGPESASAFANYANVLGNIDKNPKRANAFSKLAARLNLSHPSPMQCKTHFVYAFLLVPWIKHWRFIREELIRSHEFAVQSGNRLYKTIIGAQVAHWDPTRDLEAQCREATTYLDQMKGGPISEPAVIAKLLHQFRLNLRGLTFNIFTLSNNDYDEAQAQAQFPRTGPENAMKVYALIKAQIFWMYGDYHAAAAHFRELKNGITSLEGSPFNVEFRMFGMLTETALYANKNLDERRHIKRLLNRNLKVFKAWSETVPENYKHIYLLLLAESARISGDHPAAATLYDDACESAKLARFRRNEAIISELAGKYYLEVGRHRLAGYYLRSAYMLYRGWGAMAKAQHLLQQYQTILGADFLISNPVPNPDEAKPSATLLNGHSFPKNPNKQSSSETLDLTTVVKTSLAISSIIDYQELLGKIMQLMVENAGAQNATLLMLESGQFNVQAFIDGDRQEIYESKPLNEHAHCSRTIVRYVFRTGKNMVLHDATHEGLFTGTDYVKTWQPKSILCMPFKLKDKIAGVFYMENNLTTNAFTHQHITLLNLLLAQVSISIENARLFSESKSSEEKVRKLNTNLNQLNEDLERRVKERTSELEQTQKELIEKAHQAGMADIATTILHNVGNILNSVITSSQMIGSTVESSRLQGIVNANKLLKQHLDHDIVDFITNDPKGVQLLQYYLKLEEHYTADRDKLLDFTDRLNLKISSIRDIIMDQQLRASGGFQSEPLSLIDVAKEALTILEASLNRDQIELTTIFNPVPQRALQKNKLLHIIINIIKNAREAMQGNPPAERKLHIETGQDDDYIFLKVADNGEGIAAEQINHIFSYGFTTKKSGHGFGLHASANDMTEMGGNLSVQSDGKGKGASFSLRFPIEAEQSK